MNQSYRLSILRTANGDTTRYELKGRKEEKLLDLLLQIRQKYDPTLACRASCYTGKCGTCNVRINGESKLSCQTMISPGEYVLEPSKTGKWIRDLVTEWPFTR